MPTLSDEDERERAGNANPLIPDDQQLRHLTSIDEAQEKAMEHSAYNGAADDLARRERLDKPLSDKELDSDDKPGDPTASSSALSAAEQNKSESRDDEFNYHEVGSKAGRLIAAKQKVKGLAKKKILLGLGAFGGLGIIGVVILIVILVSTFKIQDLAQNILTYQFARVTSVFNQDALEVTSEDAAVNSSSSSLFASLQKTYGSLQDSWGNMWDKINQFVPSKVVSKLGTDGIVQFNYTPASWLKNGKLTSVTFNAGKANELTQPISSSTFYDKLHPIDSFRAQTSLASELSDTLDTALEGRSLIIRGLVENQIRQELGIKLVAWVTSKYQGLSDKQADDLDLEDSFKIIDDPSAVGSSESPAINEAATKANQDLTSCATSTACVDEVAANGGTLPSSVVNDIDSSITAATAQSVFSGILGFLNPIYKVAIPICIVYEGSLQKSQPTIDAQNAELQRTFYRIETAADQTNAGDTTGEAVGALGWQLGDTSQAIPEIRAGGGSVDTSNIMSPQASATGQYTIFNTLLPAALSGPLDTIANNCGKFTNIYLGAGIGLANLTFIIGTSLFGGGEGDVAASAAVEAGADTITDEITSQIIQDSATNTAERSVIGTIKDLASDAAKTSVEIAGITLVAHQIVASQVAAQNSGLAVGTDFADDADMGGSLNANEDCQVQFYCRPLTAAEIAESNLTTSQQASAQNATKSVYQRYFAFSNASSLVTKLGTDIQADLSISSLKSLFTKIGQIFNPFTALSKLFGALNSKEALAQSTGNDNSSNYGIVQWGYSNAELNLINTNPSYQPLENQLALGNAQPYCEEATLSGKCVQYISAADLISQLYSTCFTSSMGQLLSGTAPGLGGSPGILRDQDGNVLNTTASQIQETSASNNSDTIYSWGPISNAELCSPNELSYTNPYFGDLVFRWRLSKAYEATIDQLNAVQNAP